MPSRWFFANSLAAPVCQIFARGNNHMRPLRAGERLLGSFILPPFQRPPVWTRAQQIRLIESMWAGLPIGSYVYNQTPTYQHPCDSWLIDGQQRITAILAYVADEFSVHGYRWSEITKPEQLGFELAPMSAFLMTSESEQECRDIYDRLAYGGTAHKKKTA